MSIGGSYGDTDGHQTASTSSLNSSLVQHGSGSDLLIGGVQDQGADQVPFGSLPVQDPSKGLGSVLVVASGRGVVTDGHRELGSCVMETSAETQTTASGGLLVCVCPTTCVEACACPCAVLTRPQNTRSPGCCGRRRGGDVRPGRQAASPPPAGSRPEHETTPSA